MSTLFKWILGIAAVLIAYGMFRRWRAGQTDLGKQKAASASLAALPFARLPIKPLAQDTAGNVAGSVARRIDPVFFSAGRQPVLSAFNDATLSPWN